MPFGWEPRARDFPRRNRHHRRSVARRRRGRGGGESGSLITARFAGEQGRLVFAVPGSPLDPRADGTNRLLKDGATLSPRRRAGADDVIEALAPVSNIDARRPTVPVKTVRRSPRSADSPTPGAEIDDLR